MAQVYRHAPDTVAHLAGVRAVVAEHGGRIAAKAKANLAGHRDTGQSRITTQRQRPDFLVHLVDPAAAAIEFGGVRADGTVIRGLHILSRAAG